MEPLPFCKQSEKPVKPLFSRKSLLDSRYLFKWKELGINTEIGEFNILYQVKEIGGSERPEG